MDPRQARGLTASTGSQWTRCSAARPAGRCPGAGAVRTDTSWCRYQGRRRTAAPASPRRRCHGGVLADSAALLEPPWPIHHLDHEFFRCAAGRGPAKDPGPLSGLGFPCRAGCTGTSRRLRGRESVATPSLRVTRPPGWAGLPRGFRPLSLTRGSPGGRGRGGWPGGAGPGHRGGFGAAGTWRSAEARPSAIRGALGWFSLSRCPGAVGGPQAPAGLEGGRRSGAPVPCGTASNADGAGREAGAKSPDTGLVCRGLKLWPTGGPETYAAPAGTWSSLREARERPAPRDEGGSPVRFRRPLRPRPQPRGAHHPRGPGAAAGRGSHPLPGPRQPVDDDQQRQPLRRCPLHHHAPCQQLGRLQRRRQRHLAPTSSTTPRSPGPTRPGSPTRQRSFAPYRAGTAAPSHPRLLAPADA